MKPEDLSSSAIGSASSLFNLKAIFEDIMDGLGYACIGWVTDAGILQVSGIDGKIIIREKTGDLRDAWKEPFGGLI